MRRLAHQSPSVALGSGGRFKAVREVQDDLGRDGMLTMTIAREDRFDLVMEPTADAVGYRLSVLRTCRGSHGRTRSHGEGDEDIAAPKAFPKGAVSGCLFNRGNPDVGVDSGMGAAMYGRLRRTT